MAIWAFFSIYQSLIIFYFVVAASPNGHNSSGKVFGLWDVSTMSFTSIVVTVNLRLLMACNVIARWHHISVWGSILAWFLFIFIYSGIMTPRDRQVSYLRFYPFYLLSYVLLSHLDFFPFQENEYFVIYVLMSTFYFYLSLGLIPVVALLGDFVYQG